MTAVPGLRRIAHVDSRALDAFDAVIDVRSPGEFAEDRLPGAINLPVLDDAERAEVGTMYVQQSKFRARRIGAAYVARNISRHLETALADKPSSFRPLVYCWRGGQRSHAMATILAQVGWPVTVLEGGYRTWRRHVSERLYGDAPAPRLVLLDGPTGTAKTELLGRLAARGVQTLDLEGLAGHRGSLFGALPGRPQPSQKLFETELTAALEALDPSRPIVVEAESSKIGDLLMPPVLWRAMQTAPRIELAVPRPVRVAYLLDAYREAIEDRAALRETLARLPDRPGRKRLEEWSRLVESGGFTQLAEELVELHYDPAYARVARRDERVRLGVVVMDALTAAAQDAGAAEVERLLAGA